jgi:hypothetical protein
VEHLPWTFHYDGPGFSKCISHPQPWFFTPTKEEVFEVVRLGYTEDIGRKENNDTDALI